MSRLPEVAANTGSTTSGRRRRSAEHGGHGLDDAAVEQHAGLDGLDRIALQHGAQLRLDHRGSDGLDGAHALQVLGGDGGDDAGAVDAAGGKRLDIGLDAGAASRIGAGDGQGDRVFDQGALTC